MAKIKSKPTQALPIGRDVWIEREESRGLQIPSNREEGEVLLEHAIGEGQPVGSGKAQQGSQP